MFTTITMNRRKVLISTLFLAAMLLNLAVMPAMAKPNVVTVVLQYPDRTPYAGTFALVNARSGNWIPDIQVDSHGKANIVIPENANWVEGDLIEVRKYWSHPTLWGSGYLSKNISDRIVNKDLPLV